MELESKESPIGSLQSSYKHILSGSIPNYMVVQTSCWGGFYTKDNSESDAGT